MKICFEKAKQKYKAQLNFDFFLIKATFAKCSLRAKNCKTNFQNAKLMQTTFFQNLIFLKTLNF